MIDEAALMHAFDGGLISGAGLDVTEIEPIEMTNSLTDRNNFVLIPPPCWNECRGAPEER